MEKPQTDRKRIAKPDLLLIGALLLAGAVSLIPVLFFQRKGGASVRVTADGKVYGTYSLSEENEILIAPVKGGPVTNVLQISGKEAKMIKADCPDGLCMHQKAVSRQGETIVCLPNEIVVEVMGETSGGLDSVSR